MALTFWQMPIRERSLFAALTTVCLSACLTEEPHRRGLGGAFILTLDRPDGNVFPSSPFSPSRLCFGFFAWHVFCSSSRVFFWFYFGASSGAVVYLSLSPPFFSILSTSLSALREKQCGGTGCSRSGAADNLDNTACCVTGVLRYRPGCSSSVAAPCVIDSRE